MRQTKIQHLTYDSEILTEVYKKIVIYKKFFLLRKNPKLIKKAEALTKEFSLPKTWKDIILKYILEDDFLPDFDPNGLFLETRIDDKESDNKYYLRIFPHTSIKDIKKVWSTLQATIN